MNDTDMFLEELYKIFGYDKNKDINHQKRFTKKQVEQKINLQKYSNHTIEFKRQSISTTLGQLVKQNRIGKDGNEFFLNHIPIYNKVQIVHKFEEFKEMLDSFRRENSGKRLFFRGECGSFKYRIPSIYRKGYKQVAKYSDRFYSELLSNLGDLNILKEPRTTQLSRLQHFNAPTRMLDITTNPLVALYFAVEENNNEDHKLFFYAVDPSEIKYEFGHTALLKSSVNWMNQEIVNEFISNYIPGEENKDLGDRFLKELNEVSNSSLQFTNLDSIHEDLTSATFVEFVKESTRMKNQSGAFILPRHITRTEGNDEKEETENKLINDSILNKFLCDGKFTQQYKEIVIEANATEDIRKYLLVLGINSGYIYPDIENYSKYLIDAHYNTNDNYNG